MVAGNFSIIFIFKIKFLYIFSARAESARFLIEQGAPCGVFDSSGTPLLSLLIEKMPQIAMEAIEQFHLLDRAFRKHYYYLSYLELDPIFLGEKIPEAKRDRKEQTARNKAANKIIKEETGRKKSSGPKCYARTPLQVLIYLIFRFQFHDVGHNVCGQTRIDLHIFYCV